MRSSAPRSGLHAFRALRVPNYRLFFCGQLLSNSGTWMQDVALGWLVLQLTGDGLAVGLITSAQFLPTLVVGPWAGLLIDRSDVRRLLLLTQSAAAVLALSLGAAASLGRAGVWVLGALSLLFGCVVAVDAPGRKAFVRAMVEERDVTSAVGMNSAIWTASRVVGPAMAAVVLPIWGPVPCFYVNAASYTLILGALLMMDVRALHPADGESAGPGVRSALVAVARSARLRTTLVAMLVVATAGINFIVLLPLMAGRVFHGGGATYGLMSVAMAVGAVAGSLHTAGGGRPTSRRLAGAALAFGLSLAACAAAPELALELGALALAGATNVAFVNTVENVIQFDAAPGLRGRVLALNSMAYLGSAPVGGPLIGWLAQAAGPRAGFWVGAAATVAVSAWLLAAARAGSGPGRGGRPSPGNGGAVSRGT